MRQRAVGRMWATFLAIVLFALLAQALSAQGRLQETGRFMWQGREVVGIRVGPGLPPPVRPAPVLLPSPNPLAGTNTLSNVPAWDWCYGCSATSAAMMVGYYDNGPYPNMYTGPANGGVCPMNNATTWGAGEAPLSATHQGYDGRATRGHVGDYWIAYGNSDPDPYITNGWTEHTWGDCTGDYMGTNQSKYGNSDGGTTFFFYTNGDRIYDFTGAEPAQKDGCHGMKAFVASRGYSIASSQAFSQLIYPNPIYTSITHGFTFDDFKSAIDNGQPVMIHVTGHSMVGFGYDDTGQTVYLRDTWDHASHSMVWGGSYSGMTHYAVSCLELPINQPPTDPDKPTISPSSPKTGDDLTLSDGTGSTDPDPGDTVTYNYEWSKDDWATAGISGKTLDSSNTAEGETWKGRVQAYDGTDYSNWVVSDPVTIGNTAPSDPDKPTISPSSPKTGDDLTLSDGTGSTDPDTGDTVTYNYEWSKDDWATAGISGKTLNSSNTAQGEQWKGRVQAYDGTEYSNWVVSDPVTIGNTAPTLEWAGTSGYVSDGISPGKGVPGTTTFTFKVKYTDPDGTAPAMVRVAVRRLEDGRTWTYHTSLPLTAAPGGSWDTGRICEGSTTLPNGVYAYRFHGEDGSGAPATGDPTSWRLGPRMDAVPQLWCTGLPGRTDDFVDPNTGTAGTTRFRFAVQYTDGEGRPATMYRIEVQKQRGDGSWNAYKSADCLVWGGGPRGGKYYGWVHKLRAGQYRYRFVFRDGDGYATGSDSGYADATQWQTGPTVTDGGSDAAAGADALAVSLSAAPSLAGAEVVVSLTAPAEVSARVLNLAGRAVGSICRGMDCDAGASVLVWDARSDSGLPVPSGVYVVEVVASAPDGAQTRALTHVRIER